MYNCWDVENCGLCTKQIAEIQIRGQKGGDRWESLRYQFDDVGIRTNMPQRNQEELKKVTQMVKEKNYNHK